MECDGIWISSDHDTLRAHKNGHNNLPHKWCPEKQEAPHTVPKTVISLHGHRQEWYRSGQQPWQLILPPWVHNPAYVYWQCRYGCRYAESHWNRSILNHTSIFITYLYKYMYIGTWMYLIYTYSTYVATLIWPSFDPCTPWPAIPMPHAPSKSSHLGHGFPVDVGQLHARTGDATGRLPWKEALPHGQGVGRVLRVLPGGKKPGF